MKIKKIRGKESGHMESLLVITISIVASVTALSIMINLFPDTTKLVGEWINSGSNFWIVAKKILASILLSLWIVIICPFILVSLIKPKL